MISERTFAKSFASYWQELVPLLTPRFTSLFNEAYQHNLLDDNLIPLEAVEILPNIRADVVAEFAFWGARLTNEIGASPENLKDLKYLLEEAEKRAFHVIQKYEGIKPAVVSPLDASEIDQGLALVNNYSALYRACTPASDINFAPRFQGCGFLNAAEGDLGIDGTLIEIKTTTRKVAGNDLRQLITYLALDAGSSVQRWTHIAIFNPRRATFHRAEVDSLLLRISGGRPRGDVLRDLVEFVQATELVNDKNF